MPREHESRLTDFVHNTGVLLVQARPFVRDLVEGLQDDFVLQAALGACWQLFVDIQEQTRLLQLDNLAKPADAMAYLLDRARSGLFSLQPVHISLLAESCRFIEQGLDLVRADGNDQRLDGPAAELSVAIFRSISEQYTTGTNKGFVAASQVGMRKDFIKETKWLIEKIEQEFVLWDFIAMDQQRVSDLWRLLHRLQGNFLFFELQEPAQMCGVLVSLLQRFLDGSFFQTEYPERVFLRSIDAIRGALFRYDTVEDGSVEGLAEHLNFLHGLMRQPIGLLLIEAGLLDPSDVDQALQQQKTYRQEAQPRLGEVLVTMGKVTRDQVDRILQIQQQSLIFNQSSEISPPPERWVQDQDPDLLFSAARIHVCIESRKFAQMIDLIRDIAATKPQGKDSDVPLRALQGMMESCQREAVHAFLSRLEKVVHDLAEKNNKLVCFVIEGVRCFPDLPKLTLLAEPIIHLLRNAIEHGLEVGREREAFGKHQQGRLTLEALRMDDDLWVSIEDDGRGLDMAKLAAMAIAQGVAEPEEIKHLTGRECVDLFGRSENQHDQLNQSLYKPCGFAVVNEAVRRLGATLDVLFRPDKGTRITLKIPDRLE